MPGRISNRTTRTKIKRSDIPKFDAKAMEIFRAYGELGGRLGGKARAKNLSPERRHEIAREAALTRWRRKKQASK